MVTRNGWGVRQTPQHNLSACPEVKELHEDVNSPDKAACPNAGAAATPSVGHSPRMKSGEAAGMVGQEGLRSAVMSMNGGKTGR